MGYQDTRLWQQAFGAQCSDQFGQTTENDTITRLRNAYVSFRERASSLAGEISRDLPSLTVHDISHIDALWEMADLVLFGADNPHPEPPLNAVETFVLGCAFLTHDLAHSKAALDLSTNEIASDSLYRDILAGFVKARMEQGIGTVEATTEERDRALNQFLREKHASAAQTLPFKEWAHISGPIFLLEDQELRQYLGEAIGKVAASHHWPVNALSDEFDEKIGCPPSLQFPSCDLLLVACLMRLADGAHLDARRAPSFLHALRNPVGVADDHWVFQNRLLRPQAKGDRIVFTSGSSFDESVIDAWWLCFDTLSYLDQQLSSVDSLLTDSARQRFAIRAVAGIEDPRRLSKLIHTKKWIPVDTQVRVGNVASLVLRLGGKQLYGDDLTVPLRELIQNAGDAIQARSAVDPYFGSAGCINVSLVQRDKHWILSVRDDGVGMSESVLTGALIDFGTSFWKSPEARREFPGLAQSNFASTGRYGIGFFSVFMLGDDVKVTSRRFSDTGQGAKTLHFRHGAGSRPILSEAPVELGYMTGTLVEIVLRDDPYAASGLMPKSEDVGVTSELDELCAWLCPTFPVRIQVSVDGSPFSTVIEADDWRTVSAEKLLARLLKAKGEEDRVAIDRFINLHAPLITEMKNKDGVVLGRASLAIDHLALRWQGSREMTITVGGCRCSQHYCAVGVFQGVCDRASRDRAHLAGSRRDLDAWVAQQAELLSKKGLLRRKGYYSATLFDSCGLEREDLMVAKNRGAEMTRAGVLQYAGKRRKIILIDDSEEYDLRQNRQVEFSPSVLVTAIWLQDPFENVTGEVCTGYIKYGLRDGSHKSIGFLVGRAFAAIAESWGVSLESLRGSVVEIRKTPNLKIKVGVDQHGVAVLTSDYISLARDAAMQWDNERKQVKERRPTPKSSPRDRHAS